MTSHFAPCATPTTAQENFLHGIYAQVDRGTARHIAHLRINEGIVPTCSSGCCQCCRYNIVINAAEAHTLVRYVRREFTTERMEELKTRTRLWHRWDEYRIGRLPQSSSASAADFADFDHFCPFLVDSLCSIYQVRPMVCRTHYVLSDPAYCRSVNDPASIEAPPTAISSVVTLSGPMAAAVKDYIEKSGLDYSRSHMLLPHWLADEMGWHFDGPA
jgi:Fe-S-cluster containining protein